MRSDRGAGALALLLALATGCDDAADTPREPAPSATNLVLVTLLGADEAQLESLLSAGELPTLAALKSEARFEAKCAAPPNDGAATWHDRLVAAGRPDPAADSVAFLSSAAALGVARQHGYVREEAPQLEHFSLAIDGPDAVPTTLRRDADATAAAAFAWLARATTPFQVAIEFDAAGPVALRTIDTALAPLPAELVRAGRARRTRWIIATERTAFGGGPDPTDAAAWSDPPPRCDHPPLVAKRADVRQLTLEARGEAGGPLAREERLRRAEQAMAVAPWYFPAFRAAAVLQQQAGDARGALLILDRFAREAPLAKEARAAFEELHAATRARLEAELPGRRRDG